MLTLRELKEEVLRRPVRGLILSGADGEICRKPERTRRILVHSVAKSVTAIGAGFALEEGYLSLDESVAEAFDMDLSKVESAVGNLRGEGAAKEHRKRLEKIRLTHLMSNTSGIPVPPFIPCFFNIIQYSPLMKTERDGHGNRNIRTASCSFPSAFSTKHD